MVRRVSQIFLGILCLLVATFPLASYLLAGRNFLRFFGKLSENSQARISILIIFLIFVLVLIGLGLIVTVIEEVIEGLKQEKRGS